MLYVSLDAGEDAGQVAVFVRALRAATGHGSADDPGALAWGSVVVLTAPARCRRRWTCGARFPGWP